MKRDSVKTTPSYKDFRSDQTNDWCAGCGDHGILRALQKALAELGLARGQTAVFGGIGCSGKTPYYLNTFGIHTLHGRVLSFAAGAKLANPALNVIAVGGDGDGLSIGGGHFLNSGRRNLDMLYIMFNNGVYGLTKGQPAPTLRVGERTKSMTHSNIQGYLNPVSLALVAGYTWIGRGYAYDVPALAALMSAAMQHPGMAFLDVLQPCPKYNDLHTKDWYANKLYSLQEDGYQALVTADTDAAATQQIFAQALVRAQEWDERIAVGVFLHDLSRPDFRTQLQAMQSAYCDCPPERQPVTDANGRSMVDISPLLEELKVR